MTIILTVYYYYYYNRRKGAKRRVYYLRRGSEDLASDMNLRTLLLVVVRTVALDRPYVSEGGWRTFPHDMVAQPGPCNIGRRRRRMY